MSENWLHSRTPDGRWYAVTWDKKPTLDDIDFLIKTLSVVREGYVTRTTPSRVCGVRVVRVGTPMEITQ